MNRFILDLEPERAARFHCDKHVVKMIVEEGQMLSTVHRVAGSLDEGLYRIVHRNHPCTRWAGESTGNYEWAFRLFRALCAEYTFRYGRVHATSRLLPLLEVPPTGVPDLGLTPFPQAVSEDCKGLDPVEAYRSYYRLSKARFARWSKREVPSWWETLDPETSLKVG